MSSQRTLDLHYVHTALLKIKESLREEVKQDWQKAVVLDIPFQTPRLH